MLLATSAPAVETPQKQFEQTLKDYMKLRGAATEGLPALKANASARELNAREVAIGDAIRKARAGAKQGDIFIEEIRPVMLAVLRAEAKGPQNRDTRESIKEGNPKHEKAPGEVEPVIAVNALYPKNAPLSTVPPGLLLRLPKLPKELEYRFVGRTLVLVDRGGNVILDYIKEAVPVK